MPALAAAWLAAAFALAVPASARAQEGFAACEGFYRLPSGDLVQIGRRGIVEEMARPFFLDWETGRTENLAVAGPDSFTAGIAAGAAGDRRATPSPQTAIVFHRAVGGEVGALSILEAGLPARRAPRISLGSTREVEFASGEVTLAGTLRLPAGEGPFAAVVLVHGSGPGGRSQLSLVDGFFTRLGLAVLSYDKRGCGGSGGDWRRVDLEVLAADALAGVRWLRGRPEVDPRRVGVWGISQGGWIGPLAGALGPAEVAFVINSSGPATSLRRQDTYMMANLMERQGYAEEEIARVLKALNLAYDFGRGRAAAEVYDEAMDQVRDDPRLVDFSLPAAGELRPDSLYAKQRIGDPAWFFHLDPDRDALAPYRALRCPTLVTYGRLDVTVPVAESEALLANLRAGSPELDLTVEVIGDAGHGYARMREDDPARPLEPIGISRTWFETIETWLRARGFAGPEPGAP